MANSKQMQEFLLNFLIAGALYFFFILDGVLAYVPQTGPLQKLLLGIISGGIMWGLFWLISIGRGLIGR